MIFAAPAVLWALLALPALFFLLRVTPPAARRVAFPPLDLLRGLEMPERTPRRMPLWLLLLRLAAAALLILGLAGPSLHPPAALPGAGPLLLVIDNGWAAAPDWPARRDTALRLVAAAGESGRGVAILPTARDASNAAPAIAGVMTAARAAEWLAALQPAPWPVDRPAATAALRLAPPDATRIYLADGITDGAGFPAFMAALRPARIYSDGLAAPLLAPAGLAPNGDLMAHLLAGPPDSVALAQTQTGGVLARALFDSHGDAEIKLPLALAGQVAKIVLQGPPSAGGVLLLDGAARGTILGLAAGSANAEAPYLGQLYFARRALPPGAQIFTADVQALLADKVNALLLADLPLPPDSVQAASSFLAAGGVILRFAGPLTAATPDALTPDPLLPGERRLGGALTWGAPQSLAPFGPDSPLAGLPLDPSVTISRQVLADPTQLDPGTVWARLADGTPLILGKKIGQGYLVSVLTTANADWSNLALSGLFPDLLARLLALAHGVPARPGTDLPLTAALGAFGALAPPAQPARLATAALAGLQVSPHTPPGLYGAGPSSLAVNLGGHVPALVAAALPHAAPLAGPAPPRDLGALLLALALALLVLDLLISLRLRGLLRRPSRATLASATLALLLGALGAAPARADNPALTTSLAYALTGDAATDQLSADGLTYLSALVSSQSSARLGAPAAVTPGVDELNLYPLLYLPVPPAAPAPSPAACAALSGYMAHGGLLVIDTPGGDADAPGSGAGFAPGAAAALGRVTACLNLPPLEPLTAANVLAHCFFIVSDFPGRFTGAPVLVATAAARDADGVSPVLIGQNDWAAAWAHDAGGNAEQTPIPGGEDQRTIAERFGTNLVIYALTGSYKADQSNLPGVLDRLGQ